MGLSYKVKRGVFAVSIFLLAALGTAEAAGYGEGGIRSRLSLQTGWEYLMYEEHESDSDLESNAELHNWVFGFEGIYRMNYMFLGTKGILPLGAGREKEEWEISGSKVQTNDVTYRWWRVDGFIGFPVINLLNPYAGARWSEAKQERNDFEIMGTAVDTKSTESIQSGSALIGLMGDGNIARRWKISYSGEYHFPFYVRVTNDAIDDFEADDYEGYTWEARGGIEYFLNRTGSIGLQLSGGRMHWEGSDWERVNGSLVKWPENDTSYFNALVTFQATY
jgi:hypothetical protein